MLSRVKGWAGVGAMFVRDPLQVLTFAVLRRETPDHDSQRAEWPRERDEEIDRAYELRRRQGMSNSFAESFGAKKTRQSGPNSMSGFGKAPTPMDHENEAGIATMSDAPSSSSATTVLPVSDIGARAEDKER